MSAPTPYPPRHPKIGYTAMTLFIDQHVFEFDIPVNIANDDVHISQTTNDLSEHHAGVILIQPPSCAVILSALTLGILQYVKQGSGRAVQRKKECVR